MEKLLFFLLHRSIVTIYETQCKSGKEKQAEGGEKSKDLYNYSNKNNIDTNICSKKENNHCKNIKQYVLTKKRKWLF